MTRIQFLLPFVSIIVGLGVTGLLKDIYFLFKNRDRVKWHWIPLAWSFCAFLLLINSWFSFERTLNYSITKNAAGFSVSILPLILKFAFSKSVLPETIPEEGIDLKKYYYEEKTLIFSIFILHLIAVILLELICSGLYTSLIRNSIAVVLISALIFVNNIYYHGLITAAFSIGLIIRMSLQTSG